MKVHQFLLFVQSLPLLSCIYSFVPLELPLSSYRGTFQLLRHDPVRTTQHPTISTNNKVGVFLLLRNNKNSRPTLQSMGQDYTGKGQDDVVTCSYNSYESLNQKKQQPQQQQQNPPIQRQKQESRQHPYDPPRRRVLQQMLVASSSMLLAPPLSTLSTTTTETSTPLFPLVEPANAATFPTPRLPFFNSKYSLSVVTNNNTTAASSIRQPSKESTLFPPELATESCLLKLLPVKKPIFRKLEQQLLSISSDTLSIMSSSSLSLLLDEPSTNRGFEKIIAKMNETLTLIDSQRSYLEPVFNMDDSTVLSISKATRGESLIETLRNEIVSIQIMAKAQNTTGILECQKRALRVLAQVGELLVEKFPYEVPKEGKFSYLPRLLGRTQVTFTMVRPSGKRRRGNVGGGRGMSMSMERERVLGNVTILADGFAAPITAGNFVDLSMRNFYTGLPVKVLKKRLGVKASLTMAEDSLVAYDIASTVDKLAGEDSVIKKSIGSFMEGLGTRKNMEEPLDDGSGGAGGGGSSGPNTVLTSMPILGSFNEGFYDPLTAKPRRIPLEIVQYDRLLGTAKLSYESGFTGNAAFANSTLLSVLTPDFSRSPPLLTFDIPGLVAMNHPDLNLNGGSSEFFSLTAKDMVPERASLLNGQYAIFGYILEGFDLMQNLQAGDIISATYVDEWGRMNLKKIRGTSFADAMNSDDDGDDSG